VCCLQCAATHNFAYNFIYCPSRGRRVSRLSCISNFICISSGCEERKLVQELKVETVFRTSAAVEVLQKCICGICWEASCSSFFLQVSSRFGSALNNILQPGTLCICSSFRKWCICLVFWPYGLSEAQRIFLYLDCKIFFFLPENGSASSLHFTLLLLKLHVVLAEASRNVIWVANFTDAQMQQVTVVNSIQIWKSSKKCCSQYVVLVE
jgi:hypothetical protein